MNDVKLGDIMENAVRLCGRDVSMNAVPADWKVLAAMSLNEGVRRIAAEKFWMMTRVESRTYRPPYDEDVNWARGMQCWYAGEYWELNADAAAGEPGVDEEWVKLGMKDVPAFINWVQPWENTIIDRGGVDVTRFAYLKDPKYYPNATPIKVVGMNDFGIELEAPAPKQVFVKFVPKFPVVSFEEWNGSRAYDAGSVVYRSETRDVYIAQRDVAAGGVAPETPGTDAWQRVRVPDEFTSYLTRLVASDLLTESQGKFQTKAQADREFDELCERFHEGNGEVGVRTGRFF